MMRSAILFAGLCVATATDTGSCALNGARAVDDMLEGATYIWAATKRCQKPKTGGPGNQVLCVMNVAASIESVNAMLNVILKAVEQCGGLEGQSAKCGMAVGVLTRSFAGLAAGSAGVNAKCIKKLTFLVTPPAVTAGSSALASAAQANSLAECLVDVKDTTKSLFKATSRILSVKENCDGESSRDCTHNALKVISALAGMGEYLAGVIGRCSPHTVANKGLQEGGECGAEVMQLLREASNVARAGVSLSKNCDEGAERLYQLENGGVEMQSATGGSVTLALAALLPITAVLTFVGGSRFAKYRGQPMMQEEVE